VDLNSLQHPFDEICKDAISNGINLYRGHEDRFRKPSLFLPLQINLYDDSRLNAYAVKKDNEYEIGIYRGAIEHLFGTFYCLLSSKEFLSKFGDSSKENLSLNVLQPLPIRKSDSDAWEDFPCPIDDTRQKLALFLATNALQFLVFHEVGHILAGHLELRHLLQNDAELFEVGGTHSRRSVLSQACECDADIFATDVTNYIETHDTMSNHVHEMFGSRDRTPAQTSIILHMVAWGILFRILNGRMLEENDIILGTHPHPAIRVSIAGACSIANSTFAGKITENMTSSVIADTLTHIENFWSDCDLPGKISGPRIQWASRIHSGFTTLMRCYDAYSGIFDQFALVDRRWKKW
jgi:hypothetical protein